MSSFTTNKNLEKPNNGSYVDSWNVPLNADMNVIDAAFGSVTNLNATGGNATLSGNVSSNVTYINMALNVTGAMTANVVYTIPNTVGGMWIVRNATTDSVGGPWTITMASGGGGSNVTVLRGKASMIWSDGTNIRNVDENVSSIGTVTSVDVVGGATGLTTTGGPITTSGNITIGGVLNVASGGTNLTAFGTGVSGALSANATGSGAMVLQTNATITNSTITNATLTTPTLSNATATNATLITPILGTPTSGNLVNTTGLPIANTTGTLTVSRGGTGLTTLTANNLIVGAGTSNVTFLAPGTNGNVVTSDGTAWVSSAPNVGAWVKIAVTTVSASVAQVDFANLSSYLSLRVTFNNIRPQTDGAVFNARLSSDNGATFLTTNYTGGSNDYLEITGDGVGNSATDGGAAGTLEINNFNIAQKTTASASFVYFDDFGAFKDTNRGLAHTTQTAMSAVRFRFSSGNVTAGTILVEGWVGT
jgi:hypothetical protein